MKHRRVAAGVAPLAVFGLALSINLWRLGDSAQIDELMWMRAGQGYLAQFLRGDFEHPYWSADFESFGYPAPPVSKLLIGVGLRASEQSDDWADGLPPEGRLPSAIVSALGAAAFFLIGRRILGNAAGLGATALLIVSPVWLTASRLALVDIHAAAFSLVAILFIIRGREQILLGEWGIRAVLWYAATGLALGLAVGSKFTAGGPAIALGLLVMFQLAASLGSSAPGAKKRALLLAMGGLTMTGVALVVFIGAYPYLYTDTISRLLGVVGFWSELWETRAHSPLWPDAYLPGSASIDAAVSLLVLPSGSGRWLLLPPALAAGALWYARIRRGFSVDTSRIAIGLLALPALLAGGLYPSQLVHFWVAWAGFVLGVLTVGVRDPESDASKHSREALVAFSVASVGWLLIVLRSTYIPWPRLHLSLLPPVMLLAAAGLSGLRASLARSGAPSASLCVTAAWVLGPVAVLTAAPGYHEAQITNLVTRLSSPGLSGGLQLASMLALALFPLAWAIDRARARGRALPSQPG